jgi:hypothetical protein
MGPGRCRILSDDAGFAKINALCPTILIISLDESSRFSIIIDSFPRGPGLEMIRGYGRYSTQFAPSLLSLPGLMSPNGLEPGETLGRHDKRCQAARWLGKCLSSPSAMFFL